MLRIAARWWPAPIALVMAISMLLLVADYLQLFAMLLVTAAFATAGAFPRAASAVALVGGLLSGGSHTNLAWWLACIALGAVLIASWRLEPTRLRLLSGIAVAATAGIAIATLHSQRTAYTGYASVGEGIITWIVVILLWAAVIGARALRDYLRAESAKEQAVARTTVVESELRDERLRADLTHDFHDVMAHSLAVLAAQAEGLRLSHKQHPERIEPVLTTISDTARLALVEVRQLLERVDDDARRPQATSADIPGLVAQVRSAGPTVTLLDVGQHGHLSRLGDIAAYRIVQESLTNALRHGGTDIEILVSLTWTGPGLTFTVSSPIRDRAALKPAGRGVAGMHERARLAGGMLDIDAEGERFVVSGYLPYEPVSDRPTPPLTEEQLFTLPVPQQQRPEDVVAPWIVEATRRYRERHPETEADTQPTTTNPTLPYPADASPQRPTSWSQATTVELGDLRRGSASTSAPHPAQPDSHFGQSTPGASAQHTAQPNPPAGSSPTATPDGRIPNPMAPDETPQ